MKVKNIAFFGIMAAILGVGGAYAANDTIIASKGYVDAKTAGKQNTLNNGTNIVESGSGNAVTSVTAANGIVTVTKGSSFQPSGNYEETENKLAPNFLTYNGRTYESLSEYLTARFGDNENDKTEFLKKYYPSIGAVQSAVGDAVKMAKMTENGTMTEDATTKVYNSWKDALSNGATISEQKAFDKYTPTVAAVEKRITDLGLGSAAFTDSSDYATSDHTHSEYETTTHAEATYQPKGNYALENHTHDVYEQLKYKVTTTMIGDRTLAEYLADKTIFPDTEEGNKQKENFLKENYPSIGLLYHELQELEKKIPDTSSFITATDVPGLVTHPIDNTQEINGVTKTDVLGFTQNTTDHAPSINAVKNALTTKQLVYSTAMNSELNSINEGVTPDCSPSNPCVLTYNGNGYVWTNMDLGTNQ